MEAVGERERRRPSIEHDEAPAKNGAGRGDGQGQWRNDVKVVLPSENTTKEPLTTSRGLFSLTREQALQSLCSSDFLAPLSFDGAGCGIDEVSERIGQGSPTATANGGGDLCIVGVGAWIEVVYRKA